MIINLTVPLVNISEESGNRQIAEFEAAVDVRITYRGHAPSFNPITGAGDPGAGPEWEVDAYYIDCGEWVYTPIGKNRNRSAWIPDLIVAHQTIRPIIVAYIDTKEGRDAITTAVEEERYADA